jgi:hypothetical protein
VTLRGAHFSLATIGDFHPVIFSWLGSAADNAIVPFNLELDAHGVPGALR